MKSLYKIQWKNPDTKEWSDIGSKRYKTLFFASVAIVKDVSNPGTVPDWRLLKLKKLKYDSWTVMFEISKPKYVEPYL